MTTDYNRYRSLGGVIDHQVALSRLSPEIVVKNLYWFSRNCIQSGGTFYFKPPCISTVIMSLKRSAQAQYKCNTSFLQLLQVASKIFHQNSFTNFEPASFLQFVENSVVLQGSAQVQYKKKISYCSCTVVVLQLCGQLNSRKRDRGLTYAIRHELH